MHQFNAHGYTIFYNSDGSGDVHLQADGPGAGFTIPCEALIEFVAHLVRNERVSTLEQAEARDVLGLPNRERLLTARRVYSRVNALDNQGAPEAQDITAAMLDLTELVGTLCGVDD